MNRQTSLITILSSEHGRLRREQRDINKRDLQKAIKYGTVERSWGRRWKVEYDGIIFITDNSLRREVTAFPSPLALADIDDSARTAHSNARLVIDHRPELCVSHTVLVVDNSGSMSTHDINLHRDRQVAAYTMTALEFVAEQLFNGTANNSDLVSLVEFNNKAEVVFTREPVSWVLYNKLLARRDGRRYIEREQIKMREHHRCDSNYLPALEAAEKLLLTNYHDNCALSLLFLSDGAPSDARELGLTPAAAERRMCDRVASIATRFDGQLTISMVGFGDAYSDFATLQAMTNAAKAAPGDAAAEFVYCEKMANAVGTAISSLVSSLTATRTTLARGLNTSRSRMRRDVVSEDKILKSIEWKFYKIIEHFVYQPATSGFVHCPWLPAGALRKSNLAEAERRQRDPPPLLALTTKSWGEGAERIAFRCHLSDESTPRGFQLGAMVAKETNLVERIEENIEYHRTFCETQHLAAHLAEEFNRRLKALPDYDEKTTPKITFLECSVLLLADPEWPGGERGVLVEKMLDTEKFGWNKWNNNAGAVDGRIAHVPIDIDYELARLEGGQLDGIAEEDSDEESFETDDDISMIAEDHPVDKVTKPSDYLQAFTHFTYLFTNRKVMVCDLQGVFKADSVPPTFELSDPAIHYSSSRGREMVFGRTDKGRKGMQLFFDSHRCSDICKIMQLSKKNKDWRKQWRGAKSYDNREVGIC